MSHANSQNVRQTDLEFTGERYVPAIGGNIFLEHMHRYFLAARFVEGKAVLDIACGEGFGSNILAECAASVIGVDISDQAVTHAQRKYTTDKLKFKQGSVTDIPLPNASIDVVVSFETIEHIAEHDSMMAEVKRVLRPNGVLIISTPDKATYTDATGLTNPFHVKELYRSEFAELLSSNFAHVKMHGQKIGFGSVIAAEDGPAEFFESESASLTTHASLTRPMYLIAVASDNPEAMFGMSGLFSQDIQASEPVRKRVEYERGLWSDGIVPDFDWLSNEIASLQRSNSVSTASFSKLLRRLIVTNILYSFSRLTIFSERRRKRFNRSAEKRDPMFLAKRLDKFCSAYFSRMSENVAIAENTRRQLLLAGLKVTAIVPNYNHAGYLEQRLDSIVNQTYPLIDIIILDDCSTDDSRSIIDKYVEKHPERIRAIYNETNSGNVFSQWEKGHSLAQGDLVWICESDDFCEVDFVERTIGVFRDPSVMIGFGRIQFANENGEQMAGLDHYREDAEAGIWSSQTIRPAAQWFSNGFGVKNLIANVGGSIWRRFPIERSVWEEASSFKIMGDWFLYAALSQGGQIAYQDSAVAYFRQHKTNTSGATARSNPEYYREYTRLMKMLKKRWNIPGTTVEKFVNNCHTVYENSNVVGTPFDELMSVKDLQETPREIPHILIGLLGFSYGGGEIFPIHLANALKKRGAMVSVLQMMDTEDHADVRAMLDPSIPVYSANAVRDYGTKKFVAEAGISIIHSHLASVEIMMLDEARVDTPYLVTLHGSYEAMDISSRKISSWLKRVDQFVYTTDRNLSAFETGNFPSEKFLKFRNAMPIDERPFEKSRDDLGIKEDAVVFTFIARGIEGKGWEEAIKAFKKLRQRRPDKSIALLTVGEGEKTNSARTLAGNDPDIHFFGYINTIHGIYRTGDVALVPTRFSGESFPLCLIQAMQMGIPSVATDVGEIRNMIETEGGASGLIVPYSVDDEIFIDDLTDAMEEILDPELRNRLADNALRLGSAYSIDELASQYLDLYKKVIVDCSSNDKNRASRRAI